MADCQVGITSLKIETEAGEQSNAARSIAGLSNLACQKSEDLGGTGSIDGRVA
jgi:hypothetical protein